MLSVNPQISSANYQNNTKRNVNFKSQFVPTEYLAKGFDKAISEGYYGKNFLKAIKGFLQDGLSNVIKIDGTPGSIASSGQARRHDIFVDGKKVVDADHQIGFIFDGNQCMNAIEEFATKNNKMSYEIPADAPSAIQSLIGREASKDNISELVFRQITDKLDVLKEDYGKQISDELRKLKTQIFS